jgi:hypothetical protein
MRLLTGAIMRLFKGAIMRLFTGAIMRLFTRKKKIKQAACSHMGF